MNWDVNKLNISRKIATMLFYSTLLLSIIISAIFIFIVYKLKENSAEIIINYRLTLFLILFLLTLINIGLYLFFNKSIIKRLELIEKSMRKLIRTTDKKNNNFKDDEISNLDDEINIVLDKIINTEIHLQEEEKNYTNILNTMSNSFFHLKAIMNNEGEYIDGVIIDVNFAGTELLGLSQEDIINNKLSDIYQNFSRDKDKILEILTRIKDSKSECIAQEINIVDDKWGVVSVYSLNKGYFSIIVNDVTEIKKYAEDMTYLANYDTLTNLLNRHNLLEYLIELISRDEKFSIYFIDLDDFKNINDTLGHNTGDEILRVIADRLTDLYSDDITVGRLGGDEFIVVKRGESDLDNIKDIAEETLKLLNKNIQFSRYNFSLKASIGISCYPDHAEDVFTLLKYADISMYEGKQEGGNKYKIFSEEMLEDLNLESRWISPTGIISPTKFIPLAKKNGDIIRIDEFVLKESCEFCKKMRRLTEEDFKVSVNISYTALKQINFLERVMSIVNESNVNPNFIKIEITEDEIIDNIESTVKILNKLRKLGFNIALDDFGVGYSSFNYIKTLPLDTLKIDRSLLISVENDKKTFAIIKTLINLAHTLGLDVVCEGVEMKNQLELLTNIECDKIQGYYISKPLNLNDFYKLILNFNNIETCFKEVAVTN